MTRTLDDRFDGLAAALTGTVITPDDAGYDDARRVWNGEIDRRPGAIACCGDAADVAACVTLARERGVELAVRCGGHNSAGTGTCDGGLLIDLAELNAVVVDPGARRVRCGGGARLADLDAATQAHGLAVTAGMVSDTGVGGLTLGGGMGWLTRIAGLSVDSMVAAQVVTADGRARTVSETENPELFWALRGGGGNFGVVTEFTFRLHEVGPTVQVGLMFHEIDRGTEVLRLFRDLAATTGRDTAIGLVAVSAPPAPFVPAADHGRHVYVLIVIGFGEPGAHAAVLERARGALPPAFELVTPMPYTALQSMFDAETPPGTCCYEKSVLLDELSDEVIATIADRVPRRSSPMSQVILYVLDGAFAEVGEDATAFGGERTSRFNVFVVGLGDRPERSRDERGWVREFVTALRPRGDGIYVNGAGDGAVTASYGPAKLARLARVKAQYDPDNLFRRNVNIAPAG